jgi:hypothetical protein
MRNSGPIKIRPVHVFPFPHKINLDPVEAEMRQGDKKGCAKRKHRAKCRWISCNQRNLNIPRTVFGMGTTWGVLTSVLLCICSVLSHCAVLCTVCVWVCTVLLPPGYRGTFRIPKPRFFRAFSSVVRQIPGYNLQRQTRSALPNLVPKLFPNFSSCFSFLCNCYVCSILCILCTVCV